MKEPARRVGYFMYICPQANPGIRWQDVLALSEFSRVWSFILEEVGKIFSLLHDQDENYFL